VVPTANTTNVGSSPDFTNGPIIPNSLFPITLNGVGTHDNKSFDPFLASFAVPPLSDPCVQPPLAVDGFSHFPIFIADNADFGPPGTRLAGTYTYQVTMLDSAGNGWTISAKFTVNNKP
jgi:hypothetical protein